MANGASKYLALWFFLAGVLLIVFIQVSSGKNSQRLIQRNQQLLSEVKAQNTVRRLEANLLTIESDVRLLVITSDTTGLSNITLKLKQLKNQSALLATQLSDSFTTADLQLLNSLVQSKLFFTEEILTAYQTGGKAAGEKVINTNRGQHLRDSILAGVNKLDDLFEAHQKQIISSIETTSDRSRLWSLVLAALATVACVLAFLYFINKSRQQYKVISMLNQSEKQIKEAAQIKEQFLANMSHEIRTPMNAILGFTNLLKKTDLDEKQHQYIDYIYSSGENLLALINDILDLSKIEAGMMHIEETPFSLNGLVSSVEVMFGEKATSKNIEFTIDVEPELPDTLSGDPVRLTQILINLLSNAFKFTERGAVTLQVRALRQEGDAIDVAFTVSDTGVGIAPDKKQKIFDRFQQAEAETTRHFGGTGLGLSIVKQLVAIQKGTIELNSEVGKGSEFIVTLPLKISNEPVEKHSMIAAEVAPQLGSIKLLIAEDNIMNQQLMGHLMRQWQIAHVIVNNGREAITELEQQPFSLVLMDIQMPEMDGYAATLAIRNSLKSSVPIIAMTAHAMPGEKERCIGYGMNDYVSKPVKDAELYGILKQYAQPVSNLGVTPSVVDLAYLKELSMGDAEFEQTIIQQFIIQVPEEVKALRAAVFARDAVQMKSVAHGMKSSVSYMGLHHRLYATLHRIETAGAGPMNAEELLNDFEEVQLVCRQAVSEAAGLLKTATPVA